jgi:hypothetical protein
MGLYQSIYVGPYLIAKNKQIDSYTESKICQSPSCKGQAVSYPFCQNCGEKPELVRTPVKKKLTAYNVIHDHDESMTDFSKCFIDKIYFVEGGPKNASIGIPNNDEGRSKDTIKKCSIESDHGVSGGYPLDGIDQEADMNWFKDKFKDLISILSESLGPDSIEYKWGIVVSWG